MVYLSYMAGFWPRLVTCLQDFFRGILVIRDLVSLPSMVAARTMLLSVKKTAASGKAKDP